MKREVIFKTKPTTLLGEEVKVGDKAKDFTLINSSLEEIKLSDFRGKTVVIAIFPSIDTGVCAIQTAKFNNEIANFSKDDVQLLTVSVDLPFALSRHCADKGIENATTLSDHRNLDFGLKYGYVLDNYRLLTRGVVIIDKNGIVRYVEYVGNVSNEPNYEEALKKLKEVL